MTSPNTIWRRAQIESYSQYERVLISHSYEDKHRATPSLKARNTIHCRNATYLVCRDGSIKHIHGKPNSRRDTIRNRGKSRIKEMLY